MSGPTTFWEDQHRITVTKEFPEVSNGPAGAGLSLRQRKDIKQETAQVVVQRARRAFSPRELLGMKVWSKELLGSRGRHPPSSNRREGGQNDRSIHVTLMIGRVYDGVRRRSQTVEALHRGPCEHPGEREEKRRERHSAYDSGRQPSVPTREV